MLRRTEDLQKLTNFIDNEIYRETVGPTNFIRLQKLLLSALVILNKRRPDKVDSITIADHRMAQAQRDYRGDVINNHSLEEILVVERQIPLFAVQAIKMKLSHLGLNRRHPYQTIYGISITTSRPLKHIE